MNCLKLDPRVTRKVSVSTECGFTTEAKVQVRVSADSKSVSVTHECRYRGIGFLNLTKAEARTLAELLSATVAAS